MCVHVHARVSNSVSLFGCLCVSVSGIVREKERKLLFFFGGGVVFMSVPVCLGVCVPKKETGGKKNVAE